MHFHGSPKLASASRTPRVFNRSLTVSPSSRARLLRALLFLFLPVLLTGCTTMYRAHPGAIGPAEFLLSSPDERLVVWQRAVGVLLDQGYVPQVLNEGACFISAKRRDDITDDAFAGTIALFSVSREGLVRMEVSGVGLFHSEAQFVAAIRERQQTLLNLTLGRPTTAAKTKTE